MSPVPRTSAASEKRLRPATHALVETPAPKPSPETPRLSVPPEPGSAELDFSPSQRRALAIFALAASATLVWLALPVASGLFLGTLLAFSLSSYYERLVRRFRRRNLSALFLASTSALGILGGISGLLYVVIARGIVASTALAHGFDPGGPMRRLLARFEHATRASPLGPIDVVARVRESAGAAASKITSLAAAIAGLTVNALLTFFFMIMATFFVLRHWTELVSRAERMLPLHPLHTRVVLAECQKIGKEVFVGTLLTGAAQGLLAAVGYVLANAPEPALLGVLTAIASLVPAVGTLLVWLPVGIGLILMGHAVGGIFVLVWGFVAVIGICDYVIRPRLVGGQGHAPTLLTFISLFGGVELFGVIGLVVGPVIASVAFALLRTFDREVCQVAPEGEKAE